MRWRWASLLVAGSPFARAQQNFPDGLNGFLYTVFQTEPNLRAPAVEILNITRDLSRIQPGYLFLDPAVDIGGIGLGPLIYDTYTADLVWDGKPLTFQDALRTQNSHICDYDGSPGYICFTEFVPAGYRARHRVFDQHYLAMGSPTGWNETVGFYPSNRHEFTMVPGGRSFLTLIYMPITVDLSAIGGRVDGGILSVCFQEIDALTYEELFRWCGMDHGLTAEKSPQAGMPHMRNATKWDFAHPNSMDKNEEGDYLISLRYFNSVWKVAGLNAREKHGVEPGTVIWQLGGKESSFTYDPPEARHRWQHDARFVSTGAEESLISLFDNHNGGEGHSAGKVFAVNNKTMVAKLVREFPNPEPNDCGAMGSMRLQPNGNALVGWGQRPFFSEFDNKGDMLIHATFKNNFYNASFNYRVTKGPWVGMPDTSPKVVAYSFQCSNSPLIAYMSWNGATEVRQWRISISSARTRPWVLLGYFPKTGFETRIEFSAAIISIFSGGTPRFLLAEALGPDGEVLQGEETETFVPRPEIVANLQCDEQGCHGPKHFLYEVSQNYIHECEQGQTMSWFTILSLFLGAEGVMYTYRNLWPVKSQELEI